MQAERDLRDAFRALTLMRADLLQTRGEKQQLEAKWEQQQQRELEQREALRETFLMQEEDFRGQLHRIAAVYESERGLQGSKGSRCTRSVESMAETERPESGSDDESLKKHDGLSRSENNQEEERGGGKPGGASERRREDNNESPNVDEMVQEKLTLLAKIHRLNAIVDEQTSALLEERAQFAEAREDLTLSLEESAQQLADVEARAQDLASEKQFVEEKYEFLHTKLDLLKNDQGALTDKLRAAEEAKQEMERTIDEQKSTHQLELMALREAHESERTRLMKELEMLQSSAVDAASAATTDSDATSSAQQELEAARTKLDGREQEIGKLCAELEMAKEELRRAHDTHGSAVTDSEKKLESYTQTSLILKKELVDKEEEMAQLRVSLREKDELLRTAEGECATLKESVQKAGAERVEVEDKLKRLEEESTTIRGDLERQIGEAETRESALKLEIIELEKVKACQDQLVEELRTTKLRLEERDEDLFSRMDEVSKLRTHCEELDRVVEDQKAENGRISQQHQEVVIAAQTMKSELETDLNAARDQVSTATAELKQALEKLGLIERDNQLQHQSLSMEKKALQQEVRELKQSVKHGKDELSKSDQLRTELQHQLSGLQSQERALQAQVQFAQRQLEARETQQLRQEDRRIPDNDELTTLLASSSATHPSTAWTAVQRKIRELGTFLPQLQTLSVLMDDALCVCEANAGAFSVLSPQLKSPASSGGAAGAGKSVLFHDTVAFVRFAHQLQALVTRQPEYLKQVRRFHRRVFEVVSHWYERTDLDDIPAPPFSISSQEVALVLINWTRDKSKRLSTRQWLEQVEAFGSTSGVTIEDGVLQQLSYEGSTLVLEDMTVEVKEAFLMLIVPILRRNPSLFVRVFTRLVAPARHSSRTTVAVLEDKRWEMKIHVQASSFMSVPPRAEDMASEESDSFNVEPPPSPSSLSSISSNSTSSSMSTRWQIIQERLQRMQGQ